MNIISRLEEKMLLVLDLDETLIFADEELLSYTPDFEVGHYKVYKRPHLYEFLEFAFRNFKVGIWTSSSELYALQVVENIIEEKEGLEFIWCRDKCTKRFDIDSHSYYWIKDLKKIKKVGFRLEQVIAIDDTPQKHERNYGNLVRISEFTGQRDDKELLYLIEYLRELSNVENIRAVEKRGWQRRYDNQVNRTPSN